MSDPIRFWVQRDGDGAALDVHGEIAVFNEKEARLQLDDDEAAEMVESAPMREQFRSVFQDALDDNFGPHETLTIDECVVTMGNEVRALKDEHERWRARAEKMEKALHERITITDDYLTLNEVAENIVTVAKEALKP